MFKIVCVFFRTGPALFSSVVLALLFLGCASVPQDLSQGITDGVFYKRDMDLKVSGRRAEGVLVLPKATSYDFEIRAKGRLDLFTFATCHREETRERAGERGLFGDRRRVRLKYAPVDLESGPISCPVQIGGFEKKKGRHSWGFVDFEHESMKLPATIFCNGRTLKATGVSACESRQGLIQVIQFQTEVFWPERGCPRFETEDNKRLRFTMPQGQTTCRFKERSELGREFRITLMGYQKILIREN